MTDETGAPADDKGSKLTRKQRVFLESYLACWNATEAARRAGYAHPDVQGPRLLGNVGISAAIERRIAEKAMSADEVLIRLAEHARGDMGEFIDIGPMGFSLDLYAAKEKGITHLIKKVRQKTTTFIGKNPSDEDREVTETEIELYDAQAALVQIGRHHKLFTERQEVTGADGGPIEIVNLGIDVDKL